jgi:hypothetical protein
LFRAKSRAHISKQFLRRAQNKSLGYFPRQKKRALVGLNFVSRGKTP